MKQIKKIPLHYFDIELAEKYGVNGSVILTNIKFWLEKNKANNHNFRDGKYWTYNSKKAFLELFPYFTESQLKTILNNLIKDGALLKGNYNKLGFDRTIWYSLSDDIFDHSSDENDQSLVKPVQSMSENCPMDERELSNGLDGNDQTIPYINTDKNTNKKPISSDKKPEADDFKEIIKQWNEFASVNSLPRVLKLTDGIKKHLKVRCRETDFVLSDIISKIILSPLLLGKKTDWKVSFQWLIKNEENYLKVLSGIYDDSKEKNKEKIIYGFGTSVIEETEEEKKEILKRYKEKHQKDLELIEAENKLKKGELL